MVEQFDILDSFGRLTGKEKSRVDVHRDGDWHRSVHIWIVNNRNEILFQKRASNKDSYPNMWDISSAGHISAGEKSLDVALREVKEELGIDIQKKDLTFLTTLKKSNIYNKTFINNEFNDVYICYLSLNLSELKLQTEEVSAVKYLTLSELHQMIERQDKTLLMHLDEFNLLFNLLEKNIK